MESVGSPTHPTGEPAMKAVKLIVAVTVTALLSGCVVYPIGHGYYGYRGGGHGHWHHRR